MIVSEILGGLGNQMFQYAVGLSLATKLDTDFYVDKSQFKRYKTHRFGLDTLCLDMEFTDPKDYFLYERQKSMLSKAKAYIRRVQSQKPVLSVYREKGFPYAPAVLDQRDGTYLTGYFQSEKYFLPIREVLVESFKPKKISKPVATMAKKIENATSSISLHVRRGDYVSNPDANKHHGTKGMDYYAAALKHIFKTKNDYTVFVFSDDINWCKTNLKIDNKKIVWVDSKNSPIEDIYLMSLCKNNIIANSTFSWWGAWLNTNPKKIVVAPKVWFQDPAINTTDLIPKSWTRM